VDRSTPEGTGYRYNGKLYYALGPVVHGECQAGWTDDRGRQYDAWFRLVCEGCGHSSGEELRKVVTDTLRRTLCRECRRDADQSGVKDNAWLMGVPG
jgi:hypothetical protein